MRPGEASTRTSSRRGSCLRAVSVGHLRGAFPVPELPDVVVVLRVSPRLVAATRGRGRSSPASGAGLPPRDDRGSGRCSSARNVLEDRGPAPPSPGGTAASPDPLSKSRTIQHRVPTLPTPTTLCATSARRYCDRRCRRSHWRVWRYEKTIVVQRGQDLVARPAPASSASGTTIGGSCTIRGSPSTISVSRSRGLQSSRGREPSEIAFHTAGVRTRSQRLQELRDQAIDVEMRVPDVEAPTSAANPAIASR